MSADESDIDELLAAVTELEAEKVSRAKAQATVSRSTGQRSKPDKAPPANPDIIEAPVSATPAPHNEQEAKVKTLGTLPGHAVNGKKTLRGRPKTVERAPTLVDLQYHAEIAAQKIDFIEHDPVVQSSVRRESPIGTLRTIKTEIAKEAAALHFQRIENEKYGKDTSQISVRRVDALSKVVAVELELKKLDGDFLDLRSEKFQRVFKYLIQTIEEVAKETLTPEMIDLFFNRLGSRMEGWEERAAEEAKR
jgi:hypothetical protein